MHSDSIALRSHPGRAAFVFGIGRAACVESSMDTQLKCPHCGSNAFRLLKESDVLECLYCGRSSAFTVTSALQQAKVPAEAREPSE